MRINSKFFVLFLALITILLCFLMLWLWKRLSRRSTAAVLGRIGLVVSSQLAMTATILAAVNIYFGFYTSWQDLIGDSAQTFQMYAQPASLGQKASLGQLADASASGTTQSLHGLRSGISANVTVFVPPGYQDPAQQHTRYPTIVVDETGPTGHFGPLPRNFDLSKHGMNVPALLVYVDSGGAPAIPCTDVAGTADQQGALFWDQDLRSAIAARYRVDLAPENWGVVGMNPTAACAGTLAVVNSAYYGAAATYGAWDQAPNPQDPPDAATTPAQWLKLYPGPPSSLLLVDADDTTKAVFTGNIGELKASEQNTSSLDQMVSWLVQELAQSAAAEQPGATQWA